MSDLAHGPLILSSAYYKQKLVHAMRVFLINVFIIYNLVVFICGFSKVRCWFIIDQIFKMEEGQSKQLVGQGKKKYDLNLQEKV